MEEKEKKENHVQDSSSNALDIEEKKPVFEQEKSWWDYSVKIGEHNFKTPFFIVVAVVIVLFFTIGIQISSNLVGASVSGQVYDEIMGPVTGQVQQALDEIDSDFTSIKNEVEACIQKRSELQEAFDGTTLELTECNLERSTLEQNFDMQSRYWEDQYTELENEFEEEYQKKVADFEEAAESNWQVIENAARNICCKEKVDDSTIDSFVIKSNKISCESGASLELNC